jgi:ADP-heptose:LPS heptosyltransferase
MTSGRERIIFVELWRLGDAVSATAGLRALRLVKPDAEIAVVAHPHHGDPLFRSPDADTRIPFDAFWTRGRFARDKYLPWTIDYTELIKVGRSVRAFGPDHVLLFRGDIREQLFFRSLGARNIVDLKGPLPILPGIPTNTRPCGLHRSQEYVFHVRQWSRTMVSAQPYIAGVTRDPSVAPYILLHPGAGWIHRQWSPPKMAALIRSLEEQGHTVKLAAAPNDHYYIESIRVEYGGNLCIAYPTLNQLYFLIGSAKAVICMNSGPLHIAEALGAPCVALNGPSDHVRWGAYRAHSRNVIRSLELPCHPCKEKHCVMPKTPCIDRIELADVLQALAEVGFGAGARASASMLR